MELEVQARITNWFEAQLIYTVTDPQIRTAVHHVGCVYSYLTCSPVRAEYGHCIFQIFQKDSLPGGLSLQPYPGTGGGIVP